ncbi:WD40-repeat-containing domain protein [Leucosporidium creatinivorum]|uniref:Protein HIR n=1 Tax=Leucosporidium creatinivorum TaxID=106004 RepID=A0A1Y2D112_9BASI|nr:WD40-repeat-containing domain protein [Leucosporidium creatinivorum]
MKVVKPSWVLHIDEASHNEQSVTIYTLSLHPDGSRLATGGLDTKIRMWSTLPILDEKTEQKEEVPKLLSTLTSHSGVVMCMRWSSSGIYLASGSDDKIVMIWSLEQGTGGKVWGSTETNVENWKAVRRLVGHDSDVSGVAWSPDDAYLASSGLDGVVLIWSGQDFGLIRRLDGHMGFVKGIVFDPVGQYLASQSDDNTLKIWRTADWRMHANVAEPFEDAPKTNVVRPTWSPEGTHIVTPNSMNGPVFVAAVIDRATFKSNNSMVGHSNIVEVAAFNPLIFLRDPAKPVIGSNFCTLLALSAGSSISIWVTSQSQPLVVLDDVFDRDILDLSWSADGTQLWACSSEGHVAAFTFAISEFGTPVPAGTKESFFASNYGVQPRARPALTAQSSSSSLGGAGVGTLAQPNKLMARKGPNAKRPRTVVPTPLQQVQQQQLAPNGYPGMGAPAANPFAAAQPIAANPFAAAAPQPPAPNPFQSAPTFNAPPPPNVGWGGAIPQVQPPPVPAQAQAGPGPATAKKRKAPTNASTAEQSEQEDYYYDDGPGVPGYGSHPRLSNAPYRESGHTLGQGRKRDAPAELRVLRPIYAPREREVTFEVTNQESPEEEEGIRVLAVPAVKTFGKLKVEDSDAKDTFEWRNFGEGESKGTSEVSVSTTSKTLWVDYLPHYIVVAAGSPQFAAVSLEDGSLVVYSPTGRRLLPTLVLDSTCAFLEAEGAFLMAITALGTLSVWNTSTKKAVFPPLPVASLLSASATPTDSHPTITTSALLPNGAPVLSLSSGSTHSYDIDLCAWVIISDTWWSKGSDFWEGRRSKANQGGRGAVRTIEAAINEVVVNSLGLDPDESSSSEEESSDEEEEDEEVEDTEVEETAEEGDAEMADGEKPTSKDKGKGKAVAKKEKEKKEKAPKRKRRRKTVPEGDAEDEVGDQNMKRVAMSLAHLEVRMKAAVTLDSPAEYRTFLVAYAKKLAEESIRNKAEELLRELMGPIYYRPDKKDDWSPTVLGLNKRDLIKEVIRELARTRSFSSLCSEYNDLLKKLAAA